MSIEAITYAKQAWHATDNMGARLLLYLIAENTFNDSGLCLIGQEQLALEMGCDVRTVRRHLKAIADHEDEIPADEAERGLVVIRKRYDPQGGRKTDALELTGFKAWLGQVCAIPVAKGRKSKPDNLSGSPPLEDNLSGRATGQRCPPLPDTAVRYNKEDSRTTRTNSPPTPQGEASNGGGEETILFAKGWDQSSIEAMAEIGRSAIAKHVWDAFLKPLAADLGPPAKANPTQYVRRLWSELQGYEDADLASAVPRLKAERKRDLPSAVDVVAVVDRAARDRALEAAIEAGLEDEPDRRAVGDRLRASIRSRLGETTFASWFRTLRFDLVHGGTLHVVVETAFVRDYVLREFERQLTAAAQDVEPSVRRVAIAVKPLVRAAA